MGCEGMTSLQLLGIQLACQIVPEPQDVQDEILTDSGHKTTTTVILEGRMSFWIGRGIKPQIQRQLLEGDYSFSPLRRVHRTEGFLEIWTALDSLVLKATAIVLTKCLAPRLSKRCTHLAGNGGAKVVVREVLSKLSQNKFVFRTDVKSYYASRAVQKLIAAESHFQSDVCQRLATYNLIRLKLAVR